MFKPQEEKPTAPGIIVVPPMFIGRVKYTIEPSDEGFTARAWLDGKAIYWVNHTHRADAEAGVTNIFALYARKAK